MDRSGCRCMLSNCGQRSKKTTTIDEDYVQLSSLCRLNGSNDTWNTTSKREDEKHARTREACRKKTSMLEDDDRAKRRQKYKKTTSMQEDNKHARRPENSS